MCALRHCPETAEQRIMAEKDVLYHELLDAQRGEGCAVCRLSLRAGDSYINALLYEGVVDVGLRQRLRDARGPCHTHAWRMARKRGSVLGTAIIYRDVVNTLLKGLETPDKRTVWGGGRDSAAKRLAATAACPACQLEADAVRRAIKTLLKHIADPDIAESYVAGGGLCLPHFTETLSQAGGSAAARLIEWQATAYRRLRNELDELIRKHDYRFQSETITDREAIAATRAVAAVAGEAELLNRE
jgi:hypothetical protein